MNPEDIVVFNETWAEQKAVVDALISKLDDIEKEVLFRHLADKESFKKIGDEKGVSKQYIFKVFHSALSKMFQVDDFDTFRNYYIKRVFDYGITPVSHYGSLSLGYPSDLMREVNIGGEWKHSRLVRRRYVSRHECRMQEYLDKAFEKPMLSVKINPNYKPLENSQTVCPLCENCRGGKNRSILRTRYDRAISEPEPCEKTF